jgi:hypothetical protein
LEYASPWQGASITRMQRVRIEYADQNDSFKQMLPRRGTIVGDLREVHSQRPLTLVKLDEPFEWQQKVGEPFKFRAMRVDHFLISPRWKGFQIPGSEPASVFVHLVETDQVPTSETVDINNYVLIAWGMCYTEQN